MTERNTTGNIPINTLRDIFGDKLKENAAMSGYTTSRVGGKVDALVMIRSSADIENAAQFLWQENIPFHVIGSGAA